MIAEATTQLLGVGIHYGIPEEEYHQLPYCSNSRLCTLKDRSPLHVRHEMDNPSAPTPALVIGRALHCFALEPTEYRNRFALAPKCDRRTQKGKAAWANFRDANAGKTTLDADDAKLIDALVTSLYNDQDAYQLLQICPRREVTLIWEDESGLTCKARCDAMGDSLMVDLKTTENASRDAFERSVYTYGYHRQAAHYINGAAKLGVTITDFAFIAVEKEPPYAVAVHRLTDEAIDLGNKELRPLIERYWLCENTNNWPGYEPSDIGIPNWAARRIETAADAAR